MTCDCCKTAREFPGYRRFDPACLWCGGRYIRWLPRWVADPTQLKERRQKVLADWMQYGHAEADLRSCAKSTECFAPDGPEPVLESERPTKTKRR
jgi:hypothetical protein